MDFAATAIARHPIGGPGFTPQELLDLARTMPSAFEPGTGFTYSNSNTVLLGGIIERVAGAPLHEVLRERLFVPNGLESFHIAGVEPAPAGWGPGYTIEFAELFGATDGQAHFDQHMSMLVASSGWASGALVGTAGDVVRFQQALTSGEILKPATLNAMMAPSPVVEAFVASVGAPEIGGGLGVFLYPFPEPLGTAIGHDGGDPGFRSGMLTFPDHGISISVLVNDDRPDFGIFPRGADVDALLGAVALLILEELKGG